MADTKPSGKIPAKPGKDVVYLDVDDEITGIIDKVEGSKEKVVALVLPKRSATLQSIVNMRLLRRSADNADKNIVLITKEPALLPLAGAAGLHVAESLQGTPEVPPSPRPGAPIPPSEDIPAGEEPDPDDDNAKLDYHRSIGVLAAAHMAKEDDEAEEIDLGEEDAKDEKPAKPDKKAKEPKDSKVKIPNFDRFRVMLGLLLVGLIALIVFIILGIFVLPKATITIQTTSSPVNASFNLTTSDSAKTLDETAGTIPATLKTSDFTNVESVQATGQQNNGDKATGSVSLSAEACSPSNPFVPPPAIPNGTGVTAKGLTFKTQAATTFTITGASPLGNNCFSYPSTSNTPISATSGGANYNITATFTAQGYDASGNGSTSSGTDKPVTVVSQTDLDNAQSKVSSSNADNFSKNFQNDLTNSGLYIIPSTLKAADPAVTSTPAVGQPASTVSVTIKTTYSALTVKRSDLQQAINDKLQKQIKPTEQRLSSSDVVKSASVSVQNQNSPTVAVLSINESTSAVPILNLDSIKKQSTGQKSGDISTNINLLPGVKSVSVKLSPFWVSKAPKTSKITVVQQQVQGGN